MQFTGSDSTDPEGDPLTYEWDFGDGSPHSTEADPLHTYASLGSYTARLTMDDGLGRNPNTTVAIQVGSNEPPTAEITSPADEAPFRGGQVVQLTGTGDDPEDGPLSGDALSWDVLLRHNTHLHEVKTFSAAQGEFTAYDDHDADSHYEIILTATDSAGLIDQQQIELRPETIDFVLASSPPGAPIRYAGEGSSAAPVERTAGVRFKANIEAAEVFQVEGRVYRFDHWSDWGARKHDVTIPARDSTLTATYTRENPPDTEIDSGPSGPTSNVAPTFSFSSNDSGSAFECRIDSGSYKSCTSPFQTEPLSDGAHAFEVRATDPYVGTPDPTPARRAWSLLPLHAQATVSDALRKVAVRGGRAQLPVDCPAQRSPKCEGILSLRALSANGSAATTGPRLARRSFRLRAGKQRDFTMSLTRGRRLLRRDGRLRAQLKTVSLADGWRRVEGRTVTLLRLPASLAVRRGTVRVRVVVPPFAARDRRALIRLMRHADTLGSARIRARPGRSAAVRMRLARKWQRVLERQGHLRANVVADLSDVTGAPFRERRAVTLRPVERSR